MQRAATRLPPPDDPQIRTLDVHVKGDRGHLIGRASVPAELLLDFEAAWQAFHAKHPHYTLEQFLRYVLIKGTIIAVRRVVFNTIPEPTLFFKGTD
jgi:hypothetical protein